MSELNVTLLDGRTSFMPGAEVIGEARWSLDTPPKSIELRLFWHTSGKGTSDVQIVQIEQFDHAGAQDRRPFRFALPEGPYSFSGRLISLSWALELVAIPSQETCRQPLVLSPAGAEIDLHSEPLVLTS